MGQLGQLTDLPSRQPFDRFHPNQIFGAPRVEAPPNDWDAADNPQNLPAKRRPDVKRSDDDQCLRVVPKQQSRGATGIVEVSWSFIIIIFGVLEPEMIEKSSYTQRDLDGIWAISSFLWLALLVLPELFQLIYWEQPRTNALRWSR